MKDDEDRVGSALKICKYLSAETNLNPSNFEIIKDFAQEAAGLSMYADPVLHNYYEGQDERIGSVALSDETDLNFFHLLFLLLFQHDFR